VEEILQINMPSYQSKSLPWQMVEKAIAKEVKWLKETIIEGFHKEKDYCKDCVFRKLAILIISGRIKAKDIKSTICLWGKEKSFFIGKPHGKKWHTEMMKLVANYFRSLGYSVAIEPKLNMGRADLGIYKKSERNLFVEIGTVSLPKLLFNLESMEGSGFLIVLDSNHGVEFSVLNAGYKYYSI